MTPTHATKKAKRYRYYVSASLLAGDHPQAQKGMRVPAGDIEALVLDRLRAFFSSRIDIGDALEHCRADNRRGRSDQIRLSRAPSIPKAGAFR
jgi:hypothetical protein